MEVFPRVEMTITRGHKFKVGGEGSVEMCEGSFLHRGWWGPGMHFQLRRLRQTC